MNEQISVRVRGMECAACEQRAVAVLNRLDGIGEVVAEHHNGRVTAMTDPALVRRAQVVARLAAAGFHLVEES